MLPGTRVMSLNEAMITGLSRQLPVIPPARAAEGGEGKLPRDVVDRGLRLLDPVDRGGRRVE